jgi:ankyrin repeat protein
LFLPDIGQDMEEVGRALIERGIPLNMKDQQGNTAFQCAIMGQYVRFLTLLLEQSDIDLNSRNNDGYSALWLALSLEDDSIARTLVARGCDVNLSNSSGDSMLHFAIKSRNERASLFLIESGALIDLKNNSKKTPLHLAAENNMLQVIGVMLEKGAQLNNIDESLRTPLMVAIACGNAEAADILIANSGVHVELYDSHGASPFSLAVEGGMFAVASSLLARGAKVEGNPSLSHTPLHSAVQRGDQQSVRFLIENKANVLKLSADGLSPLSMAITQGSVSIVELLCNAGADVNEVLVVTGVPALWQALQLKKIELAAVLCKFGCNMSPIINGLGILQTAITLKDESSAMFLLSNGSNIDENSNVEQQTPLHYACDMGMSQVVAALLRMKANVNLQNKDLQTPLHRFEYFSCSI